MVRRARAEDGRAVVDHVNAVGAEGDKIMTERLARSASAEATLLRKARGDSALFLVATVEGEVAGTADVRRGSHSKNRHTAELGIALRKDLRGLGLGSAMMRAIIAWSRAAGIRKLGLGVFASNAPAIALYRKFGFIQEGRLKGQVIVRGRAVDELLMALRL